MYYIDCDFDKLCKVYNTEKCLDCIRNKNTPSDDYFDPKDDSDIEYKRVKLPKMRIAGIVYRGANLRGGLGRLWDEFYSKVPELKVKNPQRTYGVFYDINDESEFSYLAGIEVQSDSDIPEGMEVIHLATNEYAVFTHRGGVDAMPKYLDKIYIELIPKYGLRPSFDPSFEIYDDSVNEGESIVYVPIK